MFLPIVLATVCLASSRVLAAYDKPYYEVEDAENLFQEFLKEHNKVYNRREFYERLEIFKENLKKINERNDRFPNTVFAVDHFADLKHHELKAYTGLKLPNEVLPQEKVHLFDAPDSFDWRDHNVVTHVKDQHHCGSCYIFSAVGNIEGQYAIKHGKLLSYSEQQCLDCLDNGSCKGGNMGHLMQELIDKKYKLEGEEDYPAYEAKKTQCFDDPKRGTVLLLNETATRMDEEALKNKLVNYGPLAIGVDAIHFKGYQKGILEPEGFIGINHGVLLVGYGEEDGKQFWIIKNSWGAGWGERGYLRLVRGVGAAGIGTYVSYSTVA